MNILNIKLHWQILIAFIAAVFIGVIFPQYADYFKWLGDLFCVH